MFLNDLRKKGLKVWVSSVNIGNIDMSDSTWFKDFNYLPSWHMSNYKTIENIISKKNITLHDFYESMFLKISMYFNLGAAETIYRKETGRTISCMTDLLGYFPELAEMANDFLNELDI